MNITPLDIRHQEFAAGVRGYHRAAVRAYLAGLSDQFEQLLRDQQTLQERLGESERRIEQYRAAEDELRRTLVAAERIGAEMRAGAQKEAELMLRGAEVERDRVHAEARSAGGELEQQYKLRHEQLEATYRARQAELEQRHQTRASAIESEAMARRTELENSLSRLRAERAQFLAQYRALLQGFGELARHHEAELAGEGPAPRELGTSETDEDEPAPPVPTFSHQL